MMANLLARSGRREFAPKTFNSKRHHSGALAVAAQTSRGTGYSAMKNTTFSELYGQQFIYGLSVTITTIGAPMILQWRGFTWWGQG